jgi:hypothetical protein
VHNEFENHINKFKRIKMKQLTLEQTAEYLVTSTITKSIDTGFSIVHIGQTLAGARFVLINNAMGESILDESV